MWDPSVIRKMNDDYAKKARKEEKGPYILESLDDLDDMPPFPFPMLGDAADDVDLDKLDTLFCDLSGWGADYEPALTVKQLKARLREMFEEHGTLALAISEHGQFQLQLEVWKVE